MPCPLGRAPPSALENGSWTIRDCLPHRQDHRVPLAFGVQEGHVPVPPRLASFSVDPFSAEMALSSDPADLGVEMWSVFEPRPLGREGHQRFWRRGQGHLPGPLQWLSPTAFSLHVETFGEWLRPLTTASLVTLPFTLDQNYIHLHLHHHNLHVDHLQQVLLGQRHLRRETQR